MELFVINRYVGDDSVSGSATKEAELQNMFLKQIKQRKRLNQLLVQDQSSLEERKQKNTDGEEEFDSFENSFSKNHTIDGDITVLRKLKGKNKENKLETHLEKFENLEISNVGIENSKYTEISENIGETQNNKLESQFLVLGNVNVSKIEKGKRVLPNWLANPSVVSVDLKNLSCSLDAVPELDRVFLDMLKENNVSYFFPVQAQIIPWLLRSAKRPHMYWHNDICVSAPTGSGKTLAFVLPILQCLYKRIVPKIRALVVLPVQELALQVYHVFKTYSKVTSLNILLLSKKVPFEEEQALICKNDGTGKYSTSVDIMITTPGRLVEHLTKTKGLCLNELTYLVIDEADRVMENVQNDWLYHLNKSLTTECTRSYQVQVISHNNMTQKKKLPHKLLFSATLSQDPEKLQQLGLFQPKLFTSVVKSNYDKNDLKLHTQFIGKFTTPAELSEYFVCCTKMNRPLVVHHLITTKFWKNILCFVNSAKATSRLAFVLKALCNKNIKIAKLSANLTIKKRNFVLKKFSDGEIDVLISSDALARGIDIPNVQYVISYEAPKFIKTYIHRIGRTGRAGKKGTSVVLLTSKEINHFQKMILSAGKNSVEKLNINEENLIQYQEKYEKALNSLGVLLGKKQQRTLSKMKSEKMTKLQASKGKFIKNSLDSFKNKKTVKKLKE